MCLNVVISQTQTAVETFCEVVFILQVLQLFKCHFLMLGTPQTHFYSVPLDVGGAAGFKASANRTETISTDRSHHKLMSKNVFFPFLYKERNILKSSV